METQIKKMKSLPMNAWSVSRILANEKTETRRVVVPQPESDSGFAFIGDIHFHQSQTLNNVWQIDAGFRSGPDRLNEEIGPCPYGVVGNRLWVKEALYASPQSAGTFSFDYAKYEADGTFVTGAPDWHPDRPARWLWRRLSLPAMFCPRWASRLTIELTSVQLQRIQAISITSVFAEGIRPVQTAVEAMDLQIPPVYPNFQDGPDGFYETTVNPVASFRSLWDWINGHRGYGWEKNPWVWVLGFRLVS